MSGMLGQVRRRESSLAALGRFLARSLGKRHAPFHGAMLACATGTRDGGPATVTVRTPGGGPDTYLSSSMGAITGTCIAAFVTLALDHEGEHHGALAPEDWVEPLEFYAALERVGTPRHEIIDRARDVGTRG
jgi:hypothetical protein